MKGISLVPHMIWKYEEKQYIQKKLSFVFCFPNKDSTAKWSKSRDIILQGVLP